MKAYCRTNLDDCRREQWPTELCCRPVEGDAIRARSGRILFVVGVTHTEYNINEFHKDQTPVWQPMLIIELHKREAVSRNWL